MLRAEVGMRVRCANKARSKCGMIQEGEGHGPNSSENLQKARYLWVSRTPQNNIEEGARATKLVTCETREVHSAEVKVCLSARKAPIVLPLSHKRL
jgi:hypothetical protein